MFFKDTSITSESLSKKLLSLQQRQDYLNKCKNSWAESYPRLQEILKFIGPENLGKSMYDQRWSELEKQNLKNNDMFKVEQKQIVDEFEKFLAESLFHNESSPSLKK